MIIERELIELKGVGNIRVLILHFKFQFTKSIKSSAFHIPLNLTYPLRKNISFQKCPKITVKFTQNRLTVVNEMNRDLTLFETWPSYWQKGCVKQCQNSLHLYPALKSLLPFISFSFRKCVKGINNLNTSFFSRKHVWNLCSKGPSNHQHSHFFLHFLIVIQYSSHKQKDPHFFVEPTLD